MQKKSKNDVGVHTPDVQERVIVVTVSIIIGDTKNFLGVCSLQRLKGPMTGLLNTS
jgi:hypothetical protein